MAAEACWVLLRHDMAWHVLGQSWRDHRGLFGRPTLCGTTTPTEHLGVLAYSTLRPRASERSPLCDPCIA